MAHGWYILSVSFQLATTQKWHTVDTFSLSPFNWQHTEISNRL